jgi:hypothetical protein
MKYSIRNTHSKRVMLPGGWLAPGGSRLVDIPPEIAESYRGSAFLEVQKVTARKKKAKKNGDNKA